MTNADLASGGIATAQAIFAEASRLRDGGAYHLEVRRCQEVIELALKAALRAAGIDVPHVHDVGSTLLRHGDRFPDTLRASLGRLASLSRRYRREREVAFYGDERRVTRYRARVVWWRSRRHSSPRCARFPERSAGACGGATARPAATPARRSPRPAKSWAPALRANPGCRRFPGPWFAHVEHRRSRTPTRLFLRRGR